MNLFERLADRFAVERFEITRSWEKTPYLTRWTLSGKRFGSKGDSRPVFLHHFHRSDADELHSHPWGFTSIILWGGYYEITPGDGWNLGIGPLRKRWYSPGRILHRPHGTIHRIEIPEGREAWSLVFVGEKKSSWGFWCSGFFRPWREHLAMAESTGKGCGL